MQDLIRRNDDERFDTGPITNVRFGHVWAQPIGIALVTSLDVRFSINGTFRNQSRRGISATGDAGRVHAVVRLDLGLGSRT